MMIPMIAVALTLALPSGARELYEDVAAARELVRQARPSRMTHSDGGAPERDPGAAGAQACPALDALSRPWVEHAGALPRAELEAHLRYGLDAAAPSLVPINLRYWWIGASRRGRGAGEPGCLALGSAAFYPVGPEEDPQVDFVRLVGSGEEPGLRGRLIELRWFDPRDGRKHRWFDEGLARRLGWDVDGRGAPTDTPRPIPLPDAVNELY